MKLAIIADHLLEVWFEKVELGQRKSMSLLADDDHL
jgi:hypothetical protein